MVAERGDRSTEEELVAAAVEQKQERSDRSSEEEPQTDFDALTKLMEEIRAMGRCPSTLSFRASVTWIPMRGTATG